MDNIFKPNIRKGLDTLSSPDERLANLRSRHHQFTDQSKVPPADLTASQGQSNSHWESAIDKYIRDNYADLAKRSKDTQRSLQEYCEKFKNYIMSNKEAFWLQNGNLRLTIYGGATSSDGEQAISPNDKSINTNQPESSTTPARKAQEAKYYEKHRDEMRTQQAEYYQENKKEIKAKQAGYYKKNKEEKRAKQVEYRKNHKEEIKARKEHSDQLNAMLQTPEGRQQLREDFKQWKDGDR